MGILVDRELRVFGRKYIQPFDEELVNPASIDLRLGDEFIHLDSKRSYKGFYDMPAGSSVLAITHEEIEIPINYAADLKLKTTPARQGINHSMAGWIDPGYCGKLTLTLSTTRPVLLKPGMRICQIVVYRLDTVPDQSYAVVGHYMNQQHPTPAVEEKLDG